MQEMKEKVGLIPGSGRSPGIEKGNPFQYSCLENSVDRGAWRATVPGTAESWTQLTNSAQHNTFFLGQWILYSTDK